MDKYEYKVRSEEIKSLVDEKNFKRAAEIADTIDWRRVKSVLMLCTISDIYKMVRRYEDSKALLLLAYEKRQNSRMIVYALTELCVKLNDVVRAWEYYKEFCQIAPDDNRKYILLYKIYVAQDVSLEEQIKVLETYKEKEYTERWAFELAYLYHRIGFSTKCVEECDEIILWFGQGKYVRRALELKVLHEPLTAKQQALYNGERREEEENGETKLIPNLDAAIMKEMQGMDPSQTPTIEFPAKDLEEIQIKTVDMGNQYNTINLQEALAASMAELMGKERQKKKRNVFLEDDFDADDQQEEEEENWETAAVEDTGELPSAELQPKTPPRGAFESKPVISPVRMGETQELPHMPDTEEVFFEDPATGDMTDAVREISGQLTRSDATETRETYVEESSQNSISKVIVPTDPNKGIFKVKTVNPTAFAEQKSGFDDMLAQESDGQISLVVSEAQMIEKQITGQLSIQDILNEWETLKKQSEVKLMEDVKKRVLEQTGDIFAEFDEATRDGLLEQLQKKAADVEEAELARENVSKEQEEEPEEKVVEETADQEAEDQETAEQASDQNKNDAVLKDRALTQEEKELFDSFIQSKRTRAQLIQALGQMNLTPYTGNVLITGEADAGTVSFAKNLVRSMKMTDRNFSGKAAKISGSMINRKNIDAILNKLNNGALIIEEAGAMNCTTAEKIVKALQKKEQGILVVLVDTKGAVDSLLKVNSVLTDPFNLRVDVEALNDAALVSYGRKYACEKEYGIDEMGVLALHTRISDMQTMEHAVTVGEVREIVKHAISHANRKNLKHFFDVLLGRRYDEEDMIILRENDFLFDA